MEQDQRLTPLPRGVELKTATPAHYQPSYASYFDEESVEGKISIRQYLNVVYKRLPLILALGILVTAASAFYMYRQPDQYLATAQMLIEPRRPKMTSKDSININFGGDALYYSTQLQLLRGPELMKDVVVDLGLYRNPNLFETESRGVGTVFRNIFSSGKAESPFDNSLPVISDTDSIDPNATVALSPEEDQRANAYAGRLSGGLTVDQVERTNLVNVNVRSTDPVLAAKVATAVAHVFKKKDAEQETSGARKALADLTASIEELQNMIAAQETQLIEQLRQENLPLADKGTELAATRLGSLSETWLKSMESRRNLESRYNAAVAANARGEGATIPELTENKIYQDAVRIATERKAKLQDDIRAVDKQIQEAETEKAELLERGILRNQRIVAHATLVHKCCRTIGEIGHHRKAVRPGKDPRNLEKWSAEADHYVTFLFSQDADEDQFVAIAHSVRRRDAMPELQRLMTQVSMDLRNKAAEEEKAS